MIDCRVGSFFLPLLLLQAKLVSSSSAPWYYKHWCGNPSGLQYLDDRDCAKLFPPRYDREWRCPIPLAGTPPPGFAPEVPLAQVQVDTTSLTSVITEPEGINLCLVVTSRVKNASASAGMSLFNKYFCLGNASVASPYETWSSSKIFAMTNAAGRMRTNETNCGPQNWMYGLNCLTTGKHGYTPLGDLATVVCSYDETAKYTSNSLSSYFHDIGWRGRLDKTVLHEWLGASLNQTLGGNYGEATPADLSFTESSASKSCKVDVDPWPVIYKNSITALTAVEMLRRLVLHREVPEAMRFPGMSWNDTQQILYGAGETSALFPGQLWGGMTADTAIFLQAALENAKAFNAAADWRIFSKLGAGYSSSRSRGEIVSSAYGCIPAPPLSASGSVLDRGIELTINCRGSVQGDTSLEEVEARVHQAINQAVQFLKSTRFSV